jgi:hypothetical protein
MTERDAENKFVEKKMLLEITTLRQQVM